MAEAYKNMAHQKNSGYFYKALVIKKLHPQNIKTTQEWNKVSSIGTLRWTVENLLYWARTRYEYSLVLHNSAEFWPTQYKFLLKIYSSPSH